MAGAERGVLRVRRERQRLLRGSSRGDGRRGATVREAADAASEKAAEIGENLRERAEAEARPGKTATKPV